ncbi:MAG TPA: hypothetical protein VFD30_11890 [Terriglobia bacterium]|jgi:hypothetical protein|nr:hypothetical protein [Terriglobia bacterium]
MRTTRRGFAKTMVSVGAGLNAGWGQPLLAGEPSITIDEKAAKFESGFPQGSYTPFGYLDNPYHSWALHQSGVVRSVPAVGFGFYYPAGPGGYFSYEKNSIYRASLRLGFRLGSIVLFEPGDFSERAVDLRASHHSRNVLTFNFTVSNLQVSVPFFLVGENTLACLVNAQNTGTTNQELRIFAVQRFELGNESWWGRDGVAGFYDSDRDEVILRSFAAGPTLSLKADLASDDRIITPDEDALAAWMRGSKVEQRSGTTYFPKGLNAGLSCDLRVSGNGAAECGFYLSRSVNRARATQEVRSAQLQARWTLRRKVAEDDDFWSQAPQLEGDFPAHWKHSWVYDFETLRMMVRRPMGLYKHPWDAMQIQAPRNVLAETSIDMWTLCYADEEAAKAVLLGQFQDAPEPNVPCMREDGTMNMVAADGSECGTSLQWCYPFYCLESVFLRTMDRPWLEQLYPYLAAHLEWTLQHRRDRDGWIVPKCSWESGMDASQRFLIKQPTGGEVIDFVRVAELQAAMAHAARVMQQFAGYLGRKGEIARWEELSGVYTEKARELWHEGWFYDQDARTGRAIVIPGHREVTQVGPVMCGVATPEQVRAMIPKMREYESNQEFWLEWPSHVLPYVESVWKAGDREFLSRVLFAIVDRVYSSMDRRAVTAGEKLGWPGVSCEVWGAQGAYGGEGYGWGATLPAHIIRSIIGFREESETVKMTFTLGPNLPDKLLANGKVFGLRNIRYRGMSMNFRYTGLDHGRLKVELDRADRPWSSAVRVIEHERGITPPSFSVSGGLLSFEATNHALYHLEERP